MDPFDASLALSEASSKAGDGKNIRRFESVAPDSMSGGGVGFAFMYGGWLNAICLKAALEVSGSQYPHPLTLNIDFISGVKKGDSISIAVETTKSTRRLLFLRMTLSSPADGAVVLTASGLFGTLAGPKTVPTQLETRYDLKTQLAKVPRLKWPANGAPHLLIEAVKAVPGAEKMGLTEQGPLRYMDFFKLGYSPEATEKIAESIKKGAVRTETWESVHELPYVVAHPTGRKPDFFSAAFYADLFPALKTVSIAFGPVVPSVTISLSLVFCKPVSPTSRCLYMASSVPYLDRAVREEAGEGYVESFESAVWGEGGELVCLQRQQRLVTARETPGRYEAAEGKLKL